MKWITKTAKQIKQQNHRKTYFQERRERGKERGKGDNGLPFRSCKKRVGVEAVDANSAGKEVVAVSGWLEYCPLGFSAPPPPKC